MRSGSLSWIKIVSDLKLGQHGLSLGEAKATIALQADGDHLTIKGDQVSGAGITTTDQAALEPSNPKSKRLQRS